uniref:Uncharacterized protein n=1 Tax=Lotus japonicus TaxID=34305 RepID=I3SL88_LOTJA|nr:unknown [Lotus japonicus]
MEFTAPRNCLILNLFIVVSCNLCRTVSTFNTYNTLI